MSDLIAAGFNIAAVGMTVVFVFLAIVVFSTKVLGSLLANVTAAEYTDLEALRASEAQAELRRQGLTSDVDDVRVVAVISAAIAAYRAKRR